MIIVIADDITGAAEMGGIALRYGLSAVVTDEIQEDHHADVLAVYTNTRSVEKEEAISIMEELTARATLLKPQLFYKKTDSVLRGHVLGEMKAQMKVLHLERALLVPVNPSLGRVIKNGLYYVQGQPIHETSFSLDPEFPIRSSSLKEMIGSQNEEVKVISIDESLPEKGIAIGEAASNEDITTWARLNDGSVFLAGGASFFTALLAARYRRKKKISKTPSLMAFPMLFISGTKFQDNVERIAEYSSLVSYMPANIFSSPISEVVSYANWVADILEILTRKGKAIIAIDTRQNKTGNPDALRERIAEVVKIIFEKITVRELLIEGGSVAYTIVRKLGWQLFEPVEELEQGIVRMQVEGKETCLTIKPGSYSWPIEWEFN
jgi:D-threonate/D-erythronate kinase